MNTVAKRSLWSERDRRLFLLTNKARRDLLNFAYHPAIGLAFDDLSVFVLLDEIEAIDWSRVLAAQEHRFSRTLNYSSWLTCDASTMTSGYRFHMTLILPQVAQRD